MNKDIAALERAQEEKVESAYQAYARAYHLAYAAPQYLRDVMFERVREASSAYTQAWCEAHQS